MSSLKNSTLILIIIILINLIIFSNDFMDDNVLTAYGIFRFEVFQNHGTVMLLIDPISGIILEANQAAIEYYGYDKLIGKNISVINTLTDEEIRDEMKAAEKLNQNYFNFKHLLHNGEIRDVEVYSYPVELDNKNVLFSIIIDVTEKFQLKNQLEDNIREHERAETFAKFGHWKLDLNTNMLEASYGAKLIYGFSDSIMPLEKIQKHSLDKYREMLDKELSNLIYKGKPYNVEFEIQTKDGEIKWIHMTAELEEESNIIFGILHDITDRKISELNLRNRTNMFYSMLLLLFFILMIIITYLLFSIKNRKKLEIILKENNKNLIMTKKEADIANKSKSLFLSKITHDLKTPLNGISGFTEIIKERIEDDKLLNDLNYIKYSTNQMENLINNLLDVSKIENNNLCLNKESFYLKETIEKQLNSINILFKQKNNKIILNIDNNIPKNIIGDKYRLNRIIQNLLTNSNKFTKNGEIKLNISLEKETTENYTFKFIISDTGIGIEKEKLDKLFVPYYQAHDFDGKGTGLGLALCKELVELMNGEINIESEVDKGTTVTITAVFEKTK